MRGSQCLEGGVAARAFCHAADMQHVALTSCVTDDRRPEVFCARNCGVQWEKDEGVEG
jgi:hypothetical protein